jgi:hypothetical protein
VGDLPIRANIDRVISDNIDTGRYILLTLRRYSGTHDKSRSCSRWLFVPWRRATAFSANAIPHSEPFTRRSNASLIPFQPARSSRKRNKAVVHPLTNPRRRSNTDGNLSRAPSPQAELAPSLPGRRPSEAARSAVRRDHSLYRLAGFPGSTRTWGASSHQIGMKRNGQYTCRGTRPQRRLMPAHSCEGPKAGGGSIRMQVPTSREGTSSGRGGQGMGKRCWSAEKPAYPVHADIRADCDTEQEIG